MKTTEMKQKDEIIIWKKNWSNYVFFVYKDHCSVCSISTFRDSKGAGEV